MFVTCEAQSSAAAPRPHPLRFTGVPRCWCALRKKDNDEEIISFNTDAISGYEGTEPVWGSESLDNTWWHMSCANPSQYELRFVVTDNSPQAEGEVIGEVVLDLASDPIADGWHNLQPVPGMKKFRKWKGNGDLGQIFIGIEIQSSGQDAPDLPLQDMVADSASLIFKDSRRKVGQIWADYKKCRKLGSGKALV